MAALVAVIPTNAIKMPFHHVHNIKTSGIENAIMMMPSNANKALSTMIGKTHSTFQKFQQPLVEVDKKTQEEDKKLENGARGPESNVNIDEVKTSRKLSEIDKRTAWLLKINEQECEDGIEYLSAMSTAEESISKPGENMETRTREIEVKPLKFVHDSRGIGETVSNIVPGQMRHGKTYTDQDTRAIAIGHPNLAISGEIHLFEDLETSVGIKEETKKAESWLAAIEVQDYERVTTVADKRNEKLKAVAGADHAVKNTIKGDIGTRNLSWVLTKGRDVSGTFQEETEGKAKQKQSKIKETKEIPLVNMVANHRNAFNRTSDISNIDITCGTDAAAMTAELVSKNERKKECSGSSNNSSSPTSGSPTNSSSYCALPSDTLYLGIGDVNFTVPFAARRKKDDGIAISKYPEIMKLENLVANHQFKVPEMDHDVETKSTICTGNFTIPHDLPVTKENAYHQASSLAAPYPSSKSGYFVRRASLLLPESSKAIDTTKNPIVPIVFATDNDENTKRKMMEDRMNAVERSIAELKAKMAEGRGEPQVDTINFSKKLSHSSKLRREVPISVSPTNAFIKSNGVRSVESKETRIYQPLAPSNSRTKYNLNTRDNIIHDLEMDIDRSSTDEFSQYSEIEKMRGISELKHPENNEAFHSYQEDQLRGSEKPRLPQSYTDQLSSLSKSSVIFRVPATTEGIRTESTPFVSSFTKSRYFGQNTIANPNVHYLNKEDREKHSFCGRYRHPRDPGDLASSSSSSTITTTSSLSNGHVIFRQRGPSSFHSTKITGKHAHDSKLFNINANRGYHAMERFIETRIEKSVERSVELFCEKVVEEAL